MRNAERREGERVEFVCITHNTTRNPELFVSQRLAEYGKQIHIEKNSDSLYDPVTAEQVAAVSIFADKPAQILFHRIKANPEYKALYETAFPAFDGQQLSLVGTGWSGNVIQRVKATYLHNRLRALSAHLASIEEGLKDIHFERKATRVKILRAEEHDLRAEAQRVLSQLQGAIHHSQNTLLTQEDVAQMLDTLVRRIV